MTRQYKIRLGDGTVLAVDEAALRTWAIDAKAMVQPAGTRRWRPLREVLAEASLEAAARPAPPAREPVAERPRPSPPLPPDPPDEPIAAPEHDPSLDLAEVARRSLTTPLAEWVAPAPSPPSSSEPPPPLPADVPPVIRLKPLEEDEEESLEELELVAPEPRAEDRGPAAMARLEAFLAPLAAAFVRVVSKVARWAGALPAGRRPAVRTAALAGVGLAAAAVAAITWPAWGPPLMDLFAGAPPPATPTVVPRPTLATPAPRTIPPEVLRVAEQLPHLAPETVEAVMARAGHLPDPPDVFRSAYVAARRGLTALTPDEARELGGLESAVLGRLRRPERARLRAYERLRGERHLLAGEDARVMALYARGVRGLPAASRDRLRHLLGRAVAAAMAPRRPESDGAPPARGLR